MSVQKAELNVESNIESNMQPGGIPGLKLGVKIMPREVILDTQGRAVEASMKSNGFTDLTECRVGKYIELTLNAPDMEKAKSEVEKMLKDGGLYNPLIEKYEIYA